MHRRCSPCEPISILMMHSWQKPGSDAPHVRRLCSALGCPASKADREPQQHLMAVEMNEIEAPRGTTGRAPDLRFPCCGNERVRAKVGVESRTEIERLPGE